jgi:hypothetical protein
MFNEICLIRTSMEPTVVIRKDRLHCIFRFSLPVKRGGSFSFLVGTSSNALVMEIGWTDVGSGGYILVSCAHSNTSLYLYCHWDVIDQRGGWDLINWFNPYKIRFVGSQKQDIWIYNGHSLLWNKVEIIILSVFCFGVGNRHEKGREVECLKAIAWG